MDTKFQTSFMPKQSVSIGTSSSRVINIGMVVAVIIFVIALFSTIGLFALNKIIVQSTTNLVAMIEKKKSEFDIEKINALIAFSDRMDGAGTLLSKHVAPSKLLESLQAVTAKRVRFDSLTFALAVPGQKDAKTTVIAKGQSYNFESVAFQSDTFLSSAKFLKLPAIADVGVEQSGLIGFSFSATVPDSSILYETK